jgi:hypothetical protein
LIYKLDFQEYLRSQHDDQKIFIGTKGEYLLVDTSSCAHRASVPENFRDILAVTLYPSWRKHKSRRTFI